MRKLIHIKSFVRITSAVGIFSLFINGTISANAMTTGIVAGDEVNIRSGPSLESSVVQTLEKGKELEIVGYEDGWYEVKVEEVPETEPLTNHSVLSTAVPNISDLVTHKGLNYRFAPITEISGADSDSSSYYIKSDYLEMEISDIATTEGLRLRLQPNTESPVIHQFEEEERVKILYEENADWLYVEYADTYRGYISNEFIDLSYIDAGAFELLNAANQNRLSAVVKSNSLNVRLDTSTDSEIIDAFGAGDTIEVLQYTEGDEWVKIRTENDDEAYVAKAFVDIVRTLTNEVDENGYIKTVRAAIELAAAEAAAEQRAMVIREAEANRNKAKSADRTTGTNKAASGSKPENDSSASTGNMSADRTALVEWAKSWVGVTNYVYGGTDLSPGGGVDCSAFTQAVYRNFGISITRTSRSQYHDGTRINKSELQPGDLVFFGSGSISHVGIYIGDGQMVSASTAKTGIKIDSVNARKNYVGAVRVIN